MRISRPVATMLTLVVLVGAAMAPARASLAPQNPVVTGGGGVFTWLYGTKLSSAEMIDPGDFMSISGIRGYIPGSVFSSSPLFTPVATTTAGVTFIQWTSTGSDLGPVPINFGFKSDTQKLGLGSYLFGDHAIDGRPLSGSGTLQVPVTPEPAAIESMTCWLLVVLCLLAYNRKRSASGRDQTPTAFT